MIVVKQDISPAEIGDIEIGESVIVVIRRGYAFGEHDAIDPGGGGNVLKRAVAPVEKKLERLSFIADEEVEPSIIIDIDPDRSLRAGWFAQATRNGDIGESSVAIIPQQRFPLGDLPGSTQHQNIEAAVVVIVGLQNIQTTHLIGEPGLVGLVG